MVDWSFGSFDLDDQRFELRRDGEPIELRRKVFDVLRYLIAHRDRLVTKEELMREVWPGVVVQEAVLAQNVAILRKVFGDTRKNGRVIQTVHGRGYRFVADVVVREARPERSSGAPPRPVGAPFVGRDHAMRALRAALDAARGGVGRLVLVTGDAGIGKTRTLEALRAEAVAAGVRVLVGRAHEGIGAPPYWPWIQVLRAASDGSPSGTPGRDALGARARSLLGLLETGSSEVWEEAGGDARFRLFDDVTSWLVATAREAPVLVLLDDLHWAEDESLLLLRFVAREARSAPLLVVAATRDVQAGATPAASALIALLRETHAERIYLTGLALPAAAELARAVLGRDLGADHLRELQALSEGNPFFLRELLQLFADEQDEASVQRELPRRVRELVALRTRSLGTDVLGVLSAAAVIGEAFDASLLERVVGLERSASIDLLDAALRARVVRAVVPEASGPGREPLPTGAYEFAHALIRQTFYDGLSESARVRLHDLVGRALEAQRVGDPGTQLDALAHHAFLAAPGGDAERAIVACVRAAEHARSALAFERAAAQYERALQAFRLVLPTDDARRFELELALGEVTFRAGGDGTPAMLRAAEAARRVGAPDRLARVVLAMRGWPRVVRHGRTANAALPPLVAEALARLGDGVPALRARLLAAQAVDGPEETPTVERVERAAEAVALARRVADDEALFDALVARLRLPEAPEHARERAAAADELVAVARRIGRAEALFTAHSLRIGPSMTLGRIAAFDEDLTACNDLADALRLPYARLHVLRLRLARAFGDGRFDELRLLSREASSVRGPTQSTAGTAVTLFVWSAFARAYRGDRNWFERRIGEMESAVGLGPSMRGFLAFLYASFDCGAEARACYAPLLASGMLDGARDDDWLMTTALVAEAVAVCRDREAAQALYPALLPYAALVVAHEEWLIYFGACGYWLGLLAEVLGDATAARSHFDAALATNRAIGARAAAARAALARARLDVSAPGGELPRDGRARGEALLREAGALAEALGLRPVLDEVAALTR